MPPSELETLTTKLEAKKVEASEAAKVTEAISELTKHSDFLSDPEIVDLNKQIDNNAKMIVQALKDLQE